MPTCKRVGILFLVMIGMASFGGCRDQGDASEFKLFDLRDGQTISGPRAMQTVEGARLVLVGEHHTNDHHHADQLEVIRFFNQGAVPIAIGLEMFRNNQQEVLDRWVAGEINETDFIPLYLDNWNFSWQHYREIFIYARNNRIPMVGLNVSRDITRQVAREGFASLSESQRGELEGVTCKVTREYRDFIRSAFGAHGHNTMDFLKFCEAQLVWDTTMAIHALNYLEEHPGQTMILLAGSGHARKMGIPYQFRTRSSIPVTILMPHTPGLFDPEHLTSADADLIIMP